MSAQLKPETTAPDKAMICALLDAWIRQRPGLDFRNYGDATSYRAEVRSIGCDLQHARVMLRYVEARESITAGRLAAAFRDAYAGRLSLNPVPGKPGAWRLDYCTGQYWPTEYRRAACAVLASAIWAWWRDECMPVPVLMHNSETGETVGRYGGLRAGDWLLRNAAREFGRGIARTWFN